MHLVFGVRKSPTPVAALSCLATKSLDSVALVTLWGSVKLLQSGPLLASLLSHLRKSSAMLSLANIAVAKVRSFIGSHLVNSLVAIRRSIDKIYLLLRLVYNGNGSCELGERIDIAILPVQLRQPK